MLSQAVSYIENCINSQIKPDIAVILGSGLGEFADEIENSVKIPYANIPGFKASSVQGHTGQLVIGNICGKNIMVMQGRMHLYEGYSVQDVTFPEKVMKKLGIKKLIITNAAGSLNKNINIGDFMFISDHINLMGTNPLIGTNNHELGVRFPDMSCVYNKNFLNIAQVAAKKLNIKTATGVYVAMTGPSYETPAEVKMLRLLGGDAVGMSTAPEAIVANYCGIEVLGISAISNFAAGIQDTVLSHEEVMEMGKQNAGNFCSLIKQIVEDC